MLLVSISSRGGGWSSGALIDETPAIIKKSLDRLFYIISMVHLLEENFHLIPDEIERWKDILSEPYQEYLAVNRD